LAFEATARAIQGTRWLALRAVQAVMSAPTFRQLPPALQQQLQTQAQTLLYQMQAQAA
jgi:hypothetical protein